MDTAVATRDEPEVVVIHDTRPGSTRLPLHIHHGREVHCKAGTNEITVDPILRDATDDRPGHDKHHVYTRTTEKDEQGRAIFRLKTDS